jgi:hypothetical protein
MDVDCSVSSGLSSSAGSVYLFRTSETKIRQFVNPDAALLGDIGHPCKQRFEALLVGLFECAWGGSTALTDPVLQDFLHICLLAELLMKMGTSR